MSVPAGSDTPRPLWGGPGRRGALASNDADSTENRLRLSVLYARLRDSVGSLLRSMDLACA